jgi:uncharacterized protein
MKNFRWSVLLLVLVLCSAFASAETTIPKLKERVTDFTNTLSFQEWQQIDRELKTLEDTTSTQVVVLIVNSLEGVSIEEFANKTFTENKIGQAKKDNGVLLVIAKQDHSMRIEVGYGLEGVLTDAVTSQIIRREITPYFKADNYFGGIVNGVNAIRSTVAGEYHAENKGKSTQTSAGLVVLVVFFVIFVLLPMMTSRRRSIIGSGGHRYFSGWGYGGGFGSGGFGGGGFGGGGGFSGGGGMSGGGGASGSW